MTSDLQIIAAAFKQGGGGVPLLPKAINAVKDGKTAHPGGAPRSLQNRFSRSKHVAEAPQTWLTDKLRSHPEKWIPRAATVGRIC